MSHGIRTELTKLAESIDTLTPYPGNARRGDLERITASLEVHGQYRPIVAQRDGRVVLAGNHTLAAASALGWTHVAVSWVDVDDDQAREIVLVDNRTNDFATYDDEALAELLQEAQAGDRGLEGTGFLEDEVQELLDKLAESDPPAPDEEPPAEPEVYGVAIACGNEEQRDGLIATLEDLGYAPKKLDGRWGELKD